MLSVTSQKPQVPIDSKKDLSHQTTAEKLSEDISFVRNHFASDVDIIKDWKS